MGNNHMYFEENPQTKHDRKEILYTLREQNLHFTTDSNVFSKNTIDFGSRLLIERAELGSLPDGPLLDVGCGYGPIGLSLAKSSGRFVEMVDVNERALLLAKENAQKNAIKEVDIHPSNVYDQVKRKDFAGIFSNPPIRAGKKIVHQILVEAKDYLRKGGVVQVVIQKKQGAPSAMKKMEEVYGNVQVVAKEKGYYILQAKKE